MIECQKRYGIQIFDIEDDNFTFDQKRAKRLVGLIIETFGEKSLELTAMNGVSFASLDGELLRLMKRAGFQTINLSFVSITPSIKEKMGRPGLATDFDEILGKVGEAGLHAVVYAIFGMPGQTIEEMVDTLIYLMGKRVLVGPSIYYPTPGTPLYERCKKMGILPSYPSQCRSSAFPIETKDFNRFDLITLFRLARVINFIKGKIDKKEVGEGITLKEILQSMKAKVKAKAKAKAKDEAMTWNDLLLLLIQERSFFSLIKDSRGKMSVMKVGSSKKVLNYFFEKAWEKPILKSRND
jgi:hypothetical protein